MTDASPEPVEDINESEAELLVADPDDYHESQRLREIHDARQDVRKMLHQMEGWGTQAEHQTNRHDLALSVSAYIAELEPLMSAVDYDDDLEGAPWGSLCHYADCLGRYPGEEDGVAGYSTSLKVFRFANEFLAEVKPLVTQEETTEWEV